MNEIELFNNYKNNIDAFNTAVEREFLIVIKVKRKQEQNTYIGFKIYHP